MQTAFTRVYPALKWIAFSLAQVAFGSVHAQQVWPSRPIRLLVPYPPGGSTHILTRLLGQKLAESLGQPVIIENRGGASGGVGAAYFVKSAPDNHFFMVASLPMMSVNQYLYRELGYDPEADLKPIGLIGQTPNVIVTSPALPVHTLKELAEYGKANAGKLAYSSSSVGSAGTPGRRLIPTLTVDEQPRVSHPISLQAVGPKQEAARHRRAWLLPAGNRFR